VPLPASIPQAAHIILSAAPDVLLYLAIGLTPITYHLSLRRLAPVQVWIDEPRPPPFEDLWDYGSLMMGRVLC
jgi:hypothetical protein